MIHSFVTKQVSQDNIYRMFPFLLKTYLALKMTGGINTGNSGLERTLPFASHNFRYV